MKLRISFVWDWNFVPGQALTWEDGLAAALKVLIDRGHEVQIITHGDKRFEVEHPYFPMLVSDSIVEDVRTYNPDVILHWADMTRPHAAPLAELGKPMAICFAGGEALGENVELFDHIFVESKVYEDVYKENGYPVSIAFGTNTELFKPVPDQPILYDTIFPATFALWKRHDLYAKATKGLRSLACGYMYDTHEQECWKVCLENGVMIMPHVPARALKYLYAASKVCVITSSSAGGSQRTVLEAMAMNLPLVVTDSDKFDYIKTQNCFIAEPNIDSVRAVTEQAMQEAAGTRDYILENWSEHSYADALEKGLTSICQK